MIGVRFFIGQINHVRESVTEALLAWERISQKISEEMSKISSDEQPQLGTEKNVEKRYEYFQVDEHEFRDSMFQDMAKDEAAGEDGAITRVAAGGEENKF
ncbi:hypothetical protein Bca4012_022139 [Brassica carinata]